jgi:glycogen operon protein
MTPLRTSRGRSFPLGVTEAPDGINFVIFSRFAHTAQLFVWPIDSDRVLEVFALDPHLNRTGHHWHIRVGGLPGSFRYGWRIDGPRDRPGQRFVPDLTLLDPFCPAVSDGGVWGENTGFFRGPLSGGRGTHRRSLYHRRPFDWANDAPPLVPYEDSVIYELHVRGFTKHASSGVKHPGTFLGLIEKIPYLRDLGVTAVELLPVHEFDEDDCVFSNPFTGEALVNFWGYNSIAFAAPKAAYAAGGPENGQVHEFREMVKAFHEAGIEVILDVVFNHTGEGDDRGRTYSLRGFDNELFYLLDAQGHYLNFTGCGNTVNCNNSIVRNMIMRCLQYWVADMHIDGLRFDLASIFGRDVDGHVLMEPPIVEEITEDGILADTKLIAEPWDAAGLYQVGRFPFGYRWSEWNGRYRDDVRRFWRGDPGLSGALATRMCGSSDLYQHAGRLPRHSINFLACHDGFTLADLVSFNHKHNEMNGEGNRDGSNENFSWNCGIEGTTTDAEVLHLRRQQAKNLMTTLFLSQGVPMLTAGDEFLRTQQGNNNAWCQDNETSWVDWSLKESNADFHRFTKELIAFRKRRPALRRRHHFVGAGPDGQQPPDILWHGVEPDDPDFSSGSRILAFCLDGHRTDREPDRDFYVACNAWKDSLPFAIPPSPSGRPWHRVIDTSQPSPFDFIPEDMGPRVVEGRRCSVAAHSMIVLVSAAGG